MFTTKIKLQICFIGVLILAGCSRQVPTATGSTSGSKDSFSIVVMSDTQGYFGKGTKKTPESQELLSNPILVSQTDWIVRNIKKENIVFVSHAGDVVDINNREQWDFASQHMKKLHGLIPYGISVGNHDMQSSGKSSLYQEYFPASKFSGFDWYGGYFKDDELPDGISGNNANSYQLFSASGIDFLFLHLECNAPDNVLKWADSVLEQYKNRFAIVTTHMFLGPREKPVKPEDYFENPKGVMLWKKCHGSIGNSGQEMWDKCFRKHANIQLIFSGDQSRSNAVYLTQTGDNGNVVHALLSDYNASDSGGLRIYRFFPGENKVKVVTYDAINDSVLRQTDIVPDKKAHNFRIKVRI